MSPARPRPSPRRRWKGFAPDHAAVRAHARIAADVRRPAEIRPHGRHAGNRASGDRRLPSRAPGRRDRRQVGCRRNGLGDHRRLAARRRYTRRAGPAGRALYARDPLGRADRDAHHRFGVGRAGGAGRSAGAAAPARRSGGADRLADGHREGLLPRSGKRHARRRPSRHPARSRFRPAALRTRFPDFKPRPAPGRRRRPLHDPVLRQPAGQRRHAEAAARAIRRTARRRSCRMDRGQGRLSVDDGRSHRAIDDRCRSRDGRSRPRRAGTPGR